MTNTISTSVVSTARGPIEYATRGTGSPVLILHGSPGGIDAAEAMSRFLPEDSIQAILVSRPGYLGTELGDRRTPDAQAELFAALLDVLNLDKVGVLAWSGGGPSAFRFAAKYPDRVTGLVAVACLTSKWVNPTPDLSSRVLQTTRVGSWLMKKLVAYQPDQVVQGVVSSESSLAGEEFDEHVKYIESVESKKQFVLDMALTASEIGDRKAGWDNDCAEFEKLGSLNLDMITAPTLLVQGDADSDVVPSHSDEAHEQIAGSELVTLNNGTHFAFYTHPDSDAAQAKAVEYLLGTQG